MIPPRLAHVLLLAPGPICPWPPLCAAPPAPPQVPPDFIAMLGLQQALTPSRNNGFLNMFKLMQARAPRTAACWLVLVPALLLLVVLLLV